MSVKFVKRIPLSWGRGDGIKDQSTTSSSYVETGSPSYIRIDPAKFNGATYYHEAVLKTSAATGYIAIYTQAGSVVSSSEITTTATSATRLRSGAITFTAGNHTTRFKNDGSNTTTFWDDAVVVVQDANEITDTETQIELITDNYSDGSASYVDISTINWGWFLYTAANWDGSVSIFYEATFKTNSVTAYTQLHDSANSGVSGAEITTTSTSYTRVRSSAITLFNATAYKPRIKNDGTRITSINSGRIIIEQTGTITKTECHLALLMGATAYSSTMGVTNSNHKLYYDPAEFSGLATSNFYHEVSEYSGATTTALYLYEDNGGTLITSSTVNASQLSTMTRARSSVLTMPGSATTISARANSNSGTIYSAIVTLLGVITWVNNSLSPSLSPSRSPSASISITPSSSISLSSSPSPSRSLSLSPSPSPVENTLSVDLVCFHFIISYADVYEVKSTNYVDKYSLKNTVFADKYSPKNTIYEDQYTSKLPDEC